MMNRKEAIEFATGSAREALDQRDAYSNAYASYRENVIDTFTDEKVGCLDGLDAYDAECKRIGLI